MTGRRISGQLRNDPVADGEQHVQRLIQYTDRLFFAWRQPRALEIADVHSESSRPHGDFAANLSKPDDADRAAVETAGSANASPIAARHMPAVKRLVRKFRSR